jgi:2-keto-4-pentenoate hydratase/2-oxohepta-3-ene-1,7-dioic acid hydratase in catechol pathway
MKLTTLRLHDNEHAAIYAPHGLVTIEMINRSSEASWPITIAELLTTGRLRDLTGWYREGGEHQLIQMPAIAYGEETYAPLFRNPSKIWGIGMNYVHDEEELKVVAVDEEPVGFMKPSTTLIGPGDAIILPTDAGVITAEAELAIIIGKECRNITEAEAPSFVAGFTTALDMTAADIHARNPRFLTRAKSYDTFLSIGPQMITTDEIPEILDLEVATILNEESQHRNRVFNMKFRPWFTVAFHSSFMTLLPGDVILTGTPGPVVIRNGDRVECHVDGFEPLVNMVG